MPPGAKTKKVAFKLWYEGKALKEIQNDPKIRPKTKPGSVSGWVLDWERASQNTWTPRIRSN